MNGLPAYLPACMPVSPCVCRLQQCRVLDKASVRLAEITQQRRSNMQPLRMSACLSVCLQHCNSGRVSDRASVRLAETALRSNMQRLRDVCLSVRVSAALQ